MLMIKNRSVNLGLWAGLCKGTMLTRHEGRGGISTSDQEEPTMRQIEAVFTNRAFEDLQDTVRHMVVFKEICKQDKGL